jgi:hypothetical protein
MDTAPTPMICTQNRADLRERTLISLNAAKQPVMPVQTLLAACSDDTPVRMHACQAQQAERDWLPLRLVGAPPPAKRLH